ncbi:tail tape measure protein [Haloarcula tailed virus 3]|uniref:Tail tape measure protein n=1 Tax=Haloarcula tailed virus 3 TaxID=2877990 RepID=A0AAE8XZT7_9CAUD|nr:tail tape measure protein [Haloarcula tailed virus 3]UBF23382.1 tail tape measure protein [Haloarcula tailed virus 3]
MVFGDDLSVRVDAQTQDFRRGINRSTESLDDLQSNAVQTAATLGLMAGRAESAGDEMTGLSARTSAASASTAGLTSTLSTASVSASGLSTVLTISLLPALAAVAAAAVPVVAALGGLVTILGGGAFVGAAGALLAISENSERLKTQFSSLVDTIKSEFSFVIRDATTVLGSLIGAFEDIIPALVPAEDTVNEIASLFQQLGESVIDALPPFVELAVSLTREFLPAAIRLAEDVLPQLPGFFAGLVQVFRELIPSFRRAANLLVRLGPELLELGFTALNVVGPALETIGTTILDAIRGFNELSSNTQQLGIAFATVASIIAGVASILGGPVTLAIAGLTAGIIGLKTAFDNNFAGIQGIVNRFRQQVQRVIPPAKQAFDAFVSGIDFGQINEGLSTLESVIGDELNKSLTAIKPLFTDVKTLLQDNEEEFRVLGGAISDIVSAGIKGLQLLAKVLGFVFRNSTIPQLRLFVDVLDVTLTKLKNLVNLVGAVGRGEFDVAAGFAEDVVIGEGNDFPSRQDVESAGAGAAQQIEVIVEENTENLETTVRQTAQDELGRRADRTERLGNRGA